MVAYVLEIQRVPRNLQVKGLKGLRKVQYLGVFFDLKNLDFFLLGHYNGFDENEPTSDSGGKTRVLKLLKEKYGYKR